MGATLGKHRDAWGRCCKAQMELNGISLQDIADSTGYSRTYISSIINGRVMVPDETKEKVEKALGLSTTK